MDAAVKESVHDERVDLLPTSSNAENKNKKTSQIRNSQSNVNAVTESVHDERVDLPPTSSNAEDKIKRTSQIRNSQSNVNAVTESGYNNEINENRQIYSTTSLLPLTTVLPPTESREAPLAQSEPDLRLDVAPFTETKQTADSLKEKLKENSIRETETNIKEKTVEHKIHSVHMDKPQEETAKTSITATKENARPSNAPTSVSSYIAKAKAEALKKLVSESLSSISSSYEDFYDAGYFGDSDEKSIIDKVKSALSSKSFAEKEEEVDNLLLAQDDAATSALVRKMKSGLHVTRSEFYTASRILPNKEGSKSQSTTGHPTKKTTSEAASAADNATNEHLATPAKKRSVKMRKESNDEIEEPAKQDLKNLKSESNAPEDNEEKPNTSTAEN